MEQSPGSRAWRQFRRNVPAMIALVVIVLGVLISLAAYVIIPDQTANANQQTPALKLKPPGFEITLLKVKLNQPPSDQSFWNRWWNGQELEYRYIPVLEAEVHGDQLVYTEYIGNPEQGPQKRMSLANIAYPLDPGEEPGFSNGQWTLFLADGSTVSTTNTELAQEVTNSSLVRTRFLLGTDTLGRDYLSRLVLGARISLSVGFMAVLLSLIIGLLLGVLAGYFRGWVDEVILYGINVFWSIPTLLLALSIALVFSRGLSQVFIAIGLTMWVELARLVRGQMLGLRELEFVEAARSLGYGNWRIIFRHMVPNLVGPVIVVLASNFAAAILLEAGLSFLGLGVDRPTPSWGMMLSDHRTYLVAGRPHLALLPGAAISLFVLAFFLIGNGLRDAFDVKSNVSD